MMRVARFKGPREIPTGQTKHKDTRKEPPSELPVPFSGRTISLSHAEHCVASEHATVQGAGHWTQTNQCPQKA